MKKMLLVLLIFISIVLTSNAQPYSSLNLMPSFSGIGVGTRTWLLNNNGFEVNISTNWKFQDLIARAKYLRSFISDENKNIYGLVTVGYWKFKETISGNELSGSSPTVAIGGGYEWFLAKKKNVAIALELGYQYGKTNVSYNIQDFEFDHEMKALPVYFGGAVSYYINKK